MSTDISCSPNARQIADEAIGIMVHDITDRIFLIIEENRRLNRDYLRAVELQTLDKVNQEIGRRVRERFNLENKGRNQSEPKSKLILSYEQHGLRGE